jgi:hypothetical protein
MALKALAAQKRVWPKIVLGPLIHFLALKPTSTSSSGRTVLAWHVEQVEILHVLASGKTIVSQRSVPKHTLKPCLSASMKLKV